MAAREGQINCSALVGTPGNSWLLLVAPISQKGADMAKTNKKKDKGERRLLGMLVSDGGGLTTYINRSLERSEPCGIRHKRCTAEMGRLNLPC